VSELSSAKFLPQITVWERNAVSLRVPLRKQVFRASFGTKVDNHLCAQLATLNRLGEDPFWPFRPVTTNNLTNAVFHSDMAVACFVVRVKVGPDKWRSYLLAHLVGMLHPLVINIYLESIRVPFNIGLNNAREAIRVVFVFNL